MEIKTNNPAITVIVPCWKAGKYMDRLLENLQNQTFKNFAVLLVNDGDRTKQIDLDRIAAQDDRISVVWKENKIAFVAPERRYEAPVCCTTVENVI